MKYNCEDLTWIDFNKKVFEEIKNCKDIDSKLKFLSISNTNFDEFNRIRIAKLQRENNFEKIRDLNNIIKEFIQKQEMTYVELVEELFETTGKKISKSFVKGDIDLKSILENINIIPIDTNNDYFISDNMYILCVTESNRFFIEIPKSIPRVQSISDFNYILVEDIIGAYLKNLFDIIEVVNVKLTRDTVYNIVDDENIYFIMQNQIINRNSLPITKLEISFNITEQSYQFIKNKFNIHEDQIFKTSIPINLGFIHNIIEDINTSDGVIYPEFSNEDIFDKLDKESVLLEHPFDSFDNVLKFLDLCSKDPYVTEIHQTIYRVSKRSSIVESLLNASRNGKKVFVYIEICSPNDEEYNLTLVDLLKSNGVNVVYRFNGLTTHAKCMYVKRVVNNIESSYAHINTGNYNESTAKTFIDISFLTSDKNIVSDLIGLFKQLEHNVEYKFNTILFTQTNLRTKLYECIDNEIVNSKNGLDAKIKLKLNALTDLSIIDKLYQAASEGVEVELIVRGSCCLKEVSNIKIKTLVGTYLHHNRLYYFQNNNEPSLFVGSVDLVKDKIDNRVDFIYPVTDGVNRSNLLKIFERDFNS
ncbi:MAG: hypothetical protein ACRCX8_00745 [Sarcina sp.]